MTPTVEINEERLRARGQGLRGLKIVAHRRKISVITALLASGAALFVASAANAAVSCQFDDPSDTLNVQLSAGGDLAELRIDAPPTIQVRNASGSSVGCAGGAATTTTIDTVNVFDNSSSITTVAVARPENFSPGKTQEGSGPGSEIEFNVLLGGGSGYGADRLYIVGSNTAPDNWRVGTAGINFNAGNADPTPDSDTGLLSGIEFYDLHAQGGNDQVSAQGGVGTGSPFATPSRLTLEGGAGNDLLAGGNADGGESGDNIDGGPDNDNLYGFGGSDQFIASGGTNSLDGGAGRDWVEYSSAAPPSGVAVDLGQSGPQNTGYGTDSFFAVEDVRGTEGPDRLTGDAGPNDLRAFGGDDRLAGRGGSDELDGGAGVNTLSYAESPAGVSVDLAAQTATGEGTDRIFSVQNLIGSPFADTLTGSPEANAITGGAGPDRISALAGPDTVAIRDGEADTASCGSELDNATADQASLDAVDPDCETPSFLPGPDQGGGDPQTGADPQTRDTEVRFDLSGKAKQRVVEKKAVVVKASCPLEDCEAVLGGKVKPATETLAAGAPERLKLKLARKRVRKIAAALDDGRKPKVSVTAKATDAAGNVVTDSLTVRARRSR